MQNVKKRILIVDDERSILELLKFKLSRQNFEIETAQNEREFWDRVFDKKPDLIILDIWLKSKLGTDIYHSLLNFGLDPNIPVIFITALIKDQPVSDRSGNGRKYALFSKPFDFEALTQKIYDLLNYQKEEAHSHPAGA